MPAGALAPPTRHREHSSAAAFAARVVEAAGPAALVARLGRRILNRLVQSASERLSLGLSRSLQLPPAYHLSAWSQSRATTKRATPTGITGQSESAKMQTAMQPITEFAAKLRYTSLGDFMGQLTFLCKFSPALFAKAVPAGALTLSARHREQSGPAAFAARVVEAAGSRALPARLGRRTLEQAGAAAPTAGYAVLLPRAPASEAKMRRPFDRAPAAAAAADAGELTGTETPATQKGPRASPGTAEAGAVAVDRADQVFAHHVESPLVALSAVAVRIAEQKAEEPHGRPPG